MKRIRITLMFLALGVVFPTTAQEFTGIATYKSASKMSITMDSSKVSAGEQELLNQQLMRRMFLHSLFLASLSGY